MPVNLKASNALIEDVDLPADFAVALITARPELLDQIRRPLNADETQRVAHALGVLVRTNLLLRNHLTRDVENLRGQARGLANMIDTMWEHSQFREASKSYEET